MNPIDYQETRDPVLLERVSSLEHRLADLEELYKEGEA